MGIYNLADRWDFISAVFITQGQSDAIINSKK